MRRANRSEQDIRKKGKATNSHTFNAKLTFIVPSNVRERIPFPDERLL